MAEFKFYIDTIEVKAPIGWEIFETGYARILDTRGATIAKPSGDLTFYELGYDLLQNLWDKGGACGESLFKIEYRDNEFTTFATLFDGRIRSVDVEFDLFNCTATVAQVVDNSYISKVNVNADIKALLSVARSKNDSAITAVTPVNIDFFTPSTGVYNHLAKPCYQVFDVFDYLVAFCTDGNLTFASTFFGVGGDGEGVFISTGELIRAGTGAAPFVSFGELLIEMHYLFNVVVVIDDSGATPVIRVEQAATTYEQVVGKIFQSSELNSLRRRPITFGSGATPYNGDKPIANFTNLKIGSTTTQDAAGGFSYPDIQYISHKEEEYHILSDCGFKQTLELVSSFVIDSNVIEDVLITPSAAYDTNIFVVQTDYPAFNRATKFDIVNVGGNPTTYNGGLMNSERVPWFLGAIPNSIALFLGNGNDGFQAGQTVTQTYVPPGPFLYNPYAFPDDFTPPNNDPNGNYNVGTNQYVCPVAGDGAYTFEAEFRFVNVVIDAISAPSYNYTIDIDRNGGAEVKQVTGVLTGDATIIFSPNSFYLNAGDTVEVNIQVTNSVPGPGGGFDVDQAFFRTTQVENGGGIYQEIDFTTFRSAYHIFEVPMSFADFLSLTSYANRFEAIFINFGDTSKDVTGWIIQANYKIGDSGGMATIEIVADS